MSIKEHIKKIDVDHDGMVPVGHVLMVAEDADRKIDLLIEIFLNALDGECPDSQELRSACVCDPYSEDLANCKSCWRKHINEKLWKQP